MWSPSFVLRAGTHLIVASEMIDDARASTTQKADIRYTKEMFN